VAADVAEECGVSQATVFNFSIPSTCDENELRWGRFRHSETAPGSYVLDK
jgi:hypothetical protein